MFVEICDIHTVKLISGRYGVMRPSSARHAFAQRCSHSDFATFLSNYIFTQSYPIKAIFIST